MIVIFDIIDSLICFINKPGSDSICCQGNIKVEMLQESIKKIKKQYTELVIEPREHHHHH